MRVRRIKFLVGAGVSVFLLGILYLLMDAEEAGEKESSDLNGLETKLKGLENAIGVNRKTVEALKESLLELEKHQEAIDKDSGALRSKGRTSVKKTFASIYKSDYEFARSPPSSPDTNLFSVYDEIPFLNLDGGVWKQGWEISYNQSSFTPNNKLKVFVIPHSHNDPGWIKTFDTYFDEQTKHILDNIVPKLSLDPRRKFIWAEISYFSRWWVRQTSQTRDKILELLHNGQFEIVTGGWVMTDEANSYYGAMVEQLILGHEWCRVNLQGYKPNFGWSIDPFGLSPTMAYMLKRIGFDGMLIQRAHYEVKKHLAQRKNLEFRWRQHWDHEETTDMLTHLMPFYSYDIPHTCGPDPKICCQFDFDRLPQMRTSCPWRISPKPIVEANVKERSLLLLDQYKKKAQLYKTNTLLVPLGDDFRYDKGIEWDKQFENYQKIFDYVNGHSELNAELQFGTLGDYFKSLRSESKKQTGTEEGLFQSLSGDFFTYADINDNYWSGYYTSRPFFKNMDRILGGYLRAADILYSLMWAEMEYVGLDVKELAVPMMEAIYGARQNYALFQHHDGVTGTSKKHVMEDYGRRMSGSIKNLQETMTKAVHYLLTPSKAFYKYDNKKEAWFEFNEKVEGFKSVFSERTLNIDGYEPVKVVILNSHGRARSEMITIKVSSANVHVYRMTSVEEEDEEEAIVSQISPVFDGQNEILNTEFYLSFMIDTKALSLSTYFVAEMKPEEGNNPFMDVASVRLYNTVKQPFQVAPFKEIGIFSQGQPFNLENGYIRAHFDANGILEAITTLDDNTKTDVRLSFVRYTTRKKGEKSGAYLFLPEGPAAEMRVESPYVRIVEGKLFSTVHVFLPFVTHSVKISASSGVDGTGLRIDNLIDMKKLLNVEVAMRLDSALDSSSDFYTDLNGFSIIKRRRLSKIPLQANYYPVPSMAYIQDSTSRLTILTRQPLGGASLASGQIEIMLDRRLMQDDNRGMQETVTDNLPTPSSFMILLERKIQKCEDENSQGGSSYPTLLAHAARHSLLNPHFIMFFSGSRSARDVISNTYQPVEKDLACDIQILNLRTSLGSSGAGPGDDAALIIHRQGFNGCYKPIGLTCSTNGGKVSLAELFPELYSNSVKQMTLSLLYDGMKMEKSFTVSIKPMEIYSFLLKR